MSSRQEKISEKIIPGIMKFVSLKAIVALKDGILFTMPLIIVGSILLLITQFPWSGFDPLMTSIFGSEWAEPLKQAYGASFNIIAIVAAIGIAYTYVKNEGYEPLSAGVLSANSLENQAIIDSGKALTIANGAHIVTHQFLNIYINMTGTGLTLGLVLAMIFFGKSQQSKKLGGLSFVPGCFNINEPVLFGFPIVMNPIMAVPFILNPMLTGIILYCSIRFGLVAPFGGIMPPWTTPPIVSGFLAGGWRAALLQALLIIMSLLVYLPFFKKQDAINLKMEQQAVK